MTADDHGTRTPRPPIAFLALRTVGDRGHGWRPRPLEMAAAREDGTVLSTWINPDRDMGRTGLKKRSRTRDLQFAPFLNEAWPEFARFLDGHVLMVVGGQATMDLLSFEMERLGRQGHADTTWEWPKVADPMLSLEIPFEDAVEAKKHAEGKIRALLAALSTSDLLASGIRLAVDGLAPYAAQEPPGLPGVLMPPGQGLKGLHVPSVAGDRDAGETVVIAGFLRRRVTDVVMVPKLVRTLEKLQKRLGVRVLPKDRKALTFAMPAKKMKVGQLVEFTGTVRVKGMVLDSAELAALAAAKTGFLTQGDPGWAYHVAECADVLVTADLASRSNKLKRALREGRKIVDARDFIRTWLK